MFIAGRANPPLLATLLKVNLESIQSNKQILTVLVKLSFLFFFFFFFFFKFYYYFFLFQHSFYKSYNMAKLGRMLSCSFHSLCHLKSIEQDISITRS
jgi:hypothetical protein